MAACSACLVDISYETEGGAACCDEAWERFGRNCAFLSGQWGLDCSGCLCPGDLEEPPPVPPLPPHAPPEPPSPPEAPQPPLRPPLPPASPTGLGDAQFRCGFDGDHIATVDTTAALVAAVSDNSVSCIKLAPQTFALDATVQIDRPLAIAADDGPATLDGGGSVGPLLSFGSLASVALFNLVLTNAFGSMNGGALYGGPGSSLELSFVTFDSNSVDLSNYAGNGAGLYFSGLSLRMADCTFVDNVAASSGGMLIKPQSVFGEEFGITSGEPFEFFAERCIFDSNVAAYFIGGGATFQFQLACGVTVEIHDSTFSGNRAGQLGGGIVAMGCADDAMEVRDTAFTSNAIEESSAAVGGAAIYAYDMNMNVVGCTISDNAAPSSQGGGVFVKNGRVVLTSTRIKDNLAASGANLYLSQQASYVMPLPDGMWLPASACLVYRVGCPFGDAACEAALPTCQMTTVANATDCMPLTFQQPCDWDAQPELLGELLFPVPLGAIDEELPYSCGVGLLGGIAANPADQTTAMQHPPHCPAGTWSNRTGLRASTQCLPVASGYYAPTGSSLPERCPDSGFVCPGVAHDRDNDQPGSQPIAVGSGKAVALVNATLSTTQLSFSLALAASDTDGDGEAAAMALQLADFFAVATTALEVTAQQTILAVAILSDEPDAAALAETINATVAAEFSSALGTNVSALSGLQVAVVEVVTEVEDEEPCPAGYWCSAGNRIPCGTGTYNPLPEQIDMGACTACPANSDSAEASVRRGDCLCELRYYDELPNASEVRCVLCPVGSNCTVPGTTLPTLPLRRGYWRTTRESASLLQCSDGSSTDTACIGGAGSGEGSEICKPWTSGPYCRLCNVTDGTRYYDYTTSTCAECEDGNTAASVGLVLGVLAVVALATFAYGKLRPVFAQLQPRIMNVVTTLHLRCKVKQLVSLYQIVSQMGRVFVVKMPPSVTAFLSRLDVFSFELSALGLPTGCLGLSKIEEQLIFYITVPLVLGFAVFTLCVVRALVKLRGGEHGLRQAYKQGALDALPALLVLSFLVFPMVATLAFRAFSCEDFGDGASYLYADYAINCDDDAQHGPVLRLAWIAILLYPIAVPLSYVLLLRAARDAIVNEHPSTFSRALDFLHRDLEPRCYLWEVVEMFKKLFLVGFIALISPGEMVQLIIGFGFCMIFLLLTTIYDPFRADDDDLFSMLCNFVLTTCMFLCVVLNQATLSEAVEEYLADEMLERYTFNATAVSALLIGAIMLVACVVVAAVAWQLYVGMNHEVIHLQSTWQEPELPLTCKRTLWHLFLSHIWSTGQDQNATIKRQLCLLLPGVSVFLDVDDLKSIGELEEYVRASQVVQLFCSKGYFKSFNCLREVKCTLEEQKPFCLMFDPDRGGATLDVIRDEECSDELRGAVFEGRGVIRWCRIKDFQMVSLKLLAEQLLLGCPGACPDGDVHSREMPVYIPRELTRRQWGFRPHADVRVSANNPGSLAAMTVVKEELTRLLLKREDRVKSMRSLSLAGKLDDQNAKARSIGLDIVETEWVNAMAAEASFALPGSRRPRFVLYLSRQTWVGEAGQALADEVRRVRENKAVRLVMVHSTPDNADGCEFDHLFSTTPNDLIQAGLYSNLALALYPPPFRQVSACLIARELGAIDLNSALGPVKQLIYKTNQIKEVAHEISSRRASQRASISLVRLGSTMLGGASAERGSSSSSTPGSSRRRKSEHDHEPGEVHSSTPV